MLEWSPCVGDWMGSQYDLGGRRLEYDLFITTMVGMNGQSAKNRNT